MIDATQTRRWAATRAARGLVPGSPGYGRTTISGLLPTVGAVACVLPSDPNRVDVEFTDEVMATLPERFTGITANGVSSLSSTRLTDSATLRFAPGGDDDVRAYAAIRRDGGTEVGVDRRYVTYMNRDDTIYLLYTLVHLARQAIETQGRVFQLPHLDVAAPFQIVLAVPNAKGAFLGGYATGWVEPTQMFGEQAPRAASYLDPLVLLDVDQLPSTPGESLALIEQFATRICDAFNDSARRFRPVPQHGNSNPLDPRYA